MYHTGVRLLLNPDGRNCALDASSIQFRSVCFLVNSYVCDFACGQIHFSTKHSRRLTSEQRRNVSIIFYENISQACIENTHFSSWFPLSLSRQLPRWNFQTRLPPTYYECSHAHNRSFHFIRRSLIYALNTTLFKRLQPGGYSMYHLLQQ
jgi:hypothetical protein